MKADSLTIRQLLAKNWRYWEEDAILQRGKALFKVAKKIWPRPASD